MTLPNLIQAPMGALSAVGSKASLPGSDATSRQPKLGMSMWFKVTVTDPGGIMDLGAWSACQSLGVTMETEAVWAGGDYQAPYLRPKQISYPNVTLERAMTKQGSKQVALWLELVASKWIGGDEGGAGMVSTKSGNHFTGTEVHIQLFHSLTDTETLVSEWKLQGAIPVSWSAPSLSTSSGGVAIEKLVLMHRGFLGEASAGTKPKGLNSQGQGRFSLSYKGEKLEFQYNPKEVGEERTNRFGGDKDSKSLKVNTDEIIYDRKKLTLSELDIEGVTAVKSVCEKLWLWTELEADGTPKYLQLRLGSDTSGFVFNDQVVIKTTKVAYKRFTASGVPSRAAVTLTLIVVEKKTTGRQRSASAPPRRSKV